MLSILLVGKDSDPLPELAAELGRRQEIYLERVSSAKDAWKYLDDFKVDVIITDQDLADTTALPFVKEVAKTRPLINCAMVSGLPPKEFHEVTEGLGVFMQIPESPGAKDALEMIRILESINALMAS